MEDNLLTKSISKGKSFTGIHLYDHIIVGGDAYFSFKEHEML
jgi:DNA repair protein RadC